MDITDTNSKVLNNYHLCALKMLGNIYLTPTGQDFIGETSQSEQIIDFCTFSFDSCNPKAVFTAAVVLFNHVVTYKKDRKQIHN